MDTPPYKGSCLCGAIHYEVDEIKPDMGNCHCTMCRKFHGSAFATFGEADATHFHWTQGKEYLQEYRAENDTTRVFCKQCGSSLLFIPSGNDQIVEFALGTLDSLIHKKPDAHIFVDYAANWFNIEDELPQFSEHRNKNISKT